MLCGFVKNLRQPGAVTHTCNPSWLRTWYQDHCQSGNKKNCETPSQQKKGGYNGAWLSPQLQEEASFIQRPENSLDYDRLDIGLQKTGVNELWHNPDLPLTFYIPYLPPKFLGNIPRIYESTLDITYLLIPSQVCCSVLKV
jgi:hypothetical protein